MTLPGGDLGGQGSGPTDTVEGAEGSAAPVADVRIVIDSDPRRAARRLAAELGAELVEGSVAAEDLVRHRLSVGVPNRAEVDEAVRLSHSLEGFDAQDDQRSAATVSQLREAVGHRPPSGEDLARLRRLDDELAVLERVRERTEARAAQSLAARPGVPDRSNVSAERVRRAAAALIEAEGRVAAPSPTASVLDHRQATNSSVDTGTPRRTAVLVVEAAVMLLGVVLAAVVVTAGLSPALAAGPVVLAVLVALFIDRRSRRGAADNRDRHTALETLIRPADPAPTRGSQAPDPSPENELDLARRRWADIAGDADPKHVERWLHAHPEEPGLSAGAVSASPAVRAAGAAHRRARAGWRVTWADLGREPPEPHSSGSQAALSALALEVESASGLVDVDAAAALASAEAALARVRARRRLASLLGTRSLTQFQGAVSEVAEPAVVLVEPFADLGVRRAAVLRRQMRGLVHPQDVTVVVSHADHVPPL